MAVYTQQKILNVIPGQSPQLVVHCSQSDVGSAITFTLYAGSEPFEIPADSAVSVQGVRKDGAGFGPESCSVSGNQVTVTLSAAMTAVHGPAVAEITITAPGGTVSTANFALVVERAAFPNGPVVSDSPDVYQAILTYVQSFLVEAKTDATTKVSTEKTEREAADEALSDEIEALDGKLTTIRTGTFTAAGWSSSAPYSQTISVSGMTAGAYPGWDINPPSGASVAALEAIMEARNAITYIQTGAGTVTAVCAAEKPGVDLPVFFKGA